MVNSQYKKITQALRYLIAQSDNNRINILLLMKLVWAADRYHARKYATLVTDNDYRALPKGPISSTAYDIADGSDFLSEEQLQYSKRYVVRASHDVVGVAAAEIDYLSETDKEALDFAWQTFGSMNQFDVVQITHEYPEWKKFESYFANGAAAKEIDVKDFFRNPENDSYFAEDSDELEASEALFEENAGIYKLIKG
jgi:uncharacterized phage-associated protein